MGNVCMEFGVNYESPPQKNIHSLNLAAGVA